MRGELILENAKNTVILCGTLLNKPSFSHESRGEKFYVFPLSVKRLSGIYDTVNILIRENLMDSLNIESLPKITVTGQVRSFNNKGPVGNRLIISVFAKEIRFSEDSDLNCVELTGTICKAPTFRHTPMGREICDIMLAVNRKYGRSDYLPCILWGSLAKKGASLPIGTVINVSGRLQSREYIKSEESGTVKKTAYEISVTSLEIPENF